MVAKNMAYDHPAYIAVLPMPSASITGAAGVGTKFAAFTALQVKSVQVASVTAGTSADIINVVKVSGTTTTTTAYGTMGSAALVGNLTPLLPAGQVSCLQGDQFWVQKSGDLTAIFAVTVETAIVPLSNVTV